MSSAGYRHGAGLQWPVCSEDRLRQAFDEAVRPGVLPALPAALSPAKVPIRAMEDPARTATSMRSAFGLRGGVGSG